MAVTITPDTMAPPQIDNIHERSASISNFVSDELQSLIAAVPKISEARDAGYIIASDEEPMIVQAVDHFLTLNNGDAITFRRQVTVDNGGGTIVQYDDDVTMSLETSMDILITRLSPQQSPYINKSGEIDVFTGTQSSLLFKLNGIRAILEQLGDKCPHETCQRVLDGINFNWATANLHPDNVRKLEELMGRFEGLRGENPLP